MSLKPPDRSRHGLASLVLLFVLPAAIFAALVAYSQLERTSTTPQQGTPGSLVWGDGKVIFSNKQQLAAWLRLHGSSYRAFVKHHPEALRLVSARPKTKSAVQTPTKHVAASPPATKTKAKPKPAKTVTISAPATPAHDGNVSNESSRGVVFSIAAALGLLIGALALLPPALIRRTGISGSPEQERDFRFSAAAISLAILAGVGFGVLVG
jgi:hypothetical protein